MYGKACGKIIKRIYIHELDKPSRMLNKLTDTHFYYNTFDKMKVFLATQIISETCAKAIEQMLKDDGYFNSRDAIIAKATVFFCRNMNMLFDLLNAKDINDSNQFKQGISETTIHHLKALKPYVESLKHITSTTVFWLDGLKQTINAVIGLYNDYFRDLNASLLTRHMNQDPLENLFGQIRRMNTNSQNPYLLDFLRILSRILSSKIDWALTNTNCEWDQTSKLSLIDTKQELLPNISPKTIEKENEWIDYTKVCFFKSLADFLDFVFLLSFFHLIYY